MNKKILVSFLFFVGTLFSDVSMAGLADVKKELLLDIKEETVKCIIQSIGIGASGANEVTGYESTCDTVKIESNTKAQVFIDNEWYSLEIKESALSDDGDLDDLFVCNAKNEVVATRKNVAAYDNIVMAMAPGASFKQSQK